MLDRKGFLTELENYERGVRQIIPAYLTGRFKDREAFEDEVSAILWARDYLEDHMSELGPEDAELARRMDELDRLLLISKDALLAHAPFYPSFREQTQAPPTRWWYYLDKVTRTVVEQFTLAIPGNDGESEDLVTLPEFLPVRQYALKGA
jgi:hypothetical protein